MATGSGIARRLWLAFGSLFLLCGLASYFAMTTVAGIHREVYRVAEHGEGALTALELANAIRDQYAQQTDTILLGNQSHLVHYEEARRQVARLTGQVRAYAAEPGARAAIEEMERANEELDGVFLQRIVPAVLTGQSAVVKAQQVRAQELAALIANRADTLARQLAAPIGGGAPHTALAHPSPFLMPALPLGATLLAAVFAVFMTRSVGGPVVRISPVAAALVPNKKLKSIGRLLGSVAQEIINPLGVVVGYARTLQKKVEGPLAADLKVIEDEALWCQQIAKELVDLSRPSQHPNQQVDLAEMCIDVVKELQGSASSSNVQVEIEGAGSVLGNAQTLRQGVFNIVKNASEAAGPNGKVRIQIEESSEGRVAVSVVDASPGAGSNHEERSLQPVVTSRSTDPGLGLALSQAIARAHGGNIETSQAPEGGAVFILSLPARASEGDLA